MVDNLCLLRSDIQERAKARVMCGMSRCMLSMRAPASCGAARRRTFATASHRPASPLCFLACLYVNSKSTPFNTDHKQSIQANLKRLY